MKKYLISIILFIFFLSACSSPPEPPKLQNNKYYKIDNISITHDEISNKIFPNKEISSDSSLRFYKIISIKSDPINKIPNRVMQQFMFLVAHSDSIIIVGNKKNIDIYKKWLYENGLQININTIEAKSNNNDYVDFNFFKNYLATN